MTGINIIIPACGCGRRFKEQGYNEIKPMIRIFDKEMIFHVLEGLTLETDDVVFVIVNFHDDRLVQQTVKKQVKIIYIDGETRGTVETVFIGLKQIRQMTTKQRCLIMDCDAFYTDNILKKYRQTQSPHNAVFYTINTDPKPLYSYIQIEDNQIVEIAEKRKISDRANTGVYCFAEMNKLYEYCNRIISNGLTDGDGKGEFYMSCVIGEMIRFGFVFRPIMLESNRVFCVGTPEQLDIYKARTHLFSFDLDGTLVQTDEIYYSIWEILLAKYDVKLSPSLYKKYIQGNTDAVVLSSLLSGINCEEMVPLISQRKDALFIEHIHHVKIIDGVVAFLREIRDNGHKIAIVTNCNRVVAEQILRHTQIAEYINMLVIGPECIKPKPHEHPYLFALEYFGISNDKNIIFEDSKTGIQSGTKITPKCMVGIETVYTKQELLELCVDLTLPNYLGVNTLMFIDTEEINIHHKQHLLQLTRNIKQSLPNLSIQDIQWDDHKLKGGFISSVIALKITTTELNKIECVLKLSNDHSTGFLQKMAIELDLYEREYYFYNSVSSFVPVCIPHYYGTVRDDQDKNIGILMGNLYRVDGDIQMDINLNMNETAVDVPLLVIERLAKLHATFWGKNLEKQFPYLKKNNDPLFRPKWGNFIRSKWVEFKEKWRIMISPFLMENVDNIVQRFDDIQDELSMGDHLTLCHGDVKSPNMFFTQGGDKEPYFIDWQYICIGKGVQDLVFFLIESFDAETMRKYKPLFKQHYYLKLQEFGVLHYSVEEYNRDFDNAIFYFPLFVAVWFGTLDPDELMDKDFPTIFIKQLFNFMV